MNKIIFYFLLIFCNFLYSQKKLHYLINLDFTNQNSNLTVGIGPEIYFVYNNNQITTLNGNLMYDLSNKNIFPEIGINQHFNIKFFNPYSSNFKSNFWNIGASISTEYIRPEFGINLLDLISVKCGYNFVYQSASNYKGFNLGVNLHLPIIVFKKN